MSVRAKFRVTRINKSDALQDDPNKPGEKKLAEVQSIHMTPVVNGSDENKEFFKYTPSGEIVLGVMNPAAAEQFVVDKEYYVDFTPA